MKYLPLKSAAIQIRALRNLLSRRWQYRRMRRFYRQFIKPGNLAFDVGAHVGSRTRAFLQLGARVVSVEPQKECARVLFASFGANPHFHLVNKALGAAEGESEMFISNDTEKTSLSLEWIKAPKPAQYRKIFWGASRQVKVTTLDLLIEDYGMPAFVKIDAEGFEHEIIQGLSHPLPAISLEFLSSYLDPALKCLEYLSQHESVLVNYTVEEQWAWVFPKWVDPAEMIAVLKNKQYGTNILYGDVYIRLLGRT
jgi:FkbM family methyltransferase